jgi:hypothetical protein
VLLDWVGQQVQRLPEQLQQMVGAGVVHVVEQQLAVVLRTLAEGELADVENVILGG